MDKYDELIQSALIDVKNSKSIESIEKTRVKYFGKNGIINKELKLISTLDNDQKKKYWPKAQ